MKHLNPVTSGLLALALAVPVTASAASRTKRTFSTSSSKVSAASISPVSLADANTPVLRIAGAATYRPPVQKAIEDSLNSGYTFGYVGNRYRPTASIYSGTLKSTSQAVIIETYWTGDLAGVVDLATQNTITKWINRSYAISGSPSALATGSGASIPAGYTTESAVPNVAVTVSFASSSAAAVSTANASGVAAAKAILATSLTDAGSAAKAGGALTVGLAAFQWVIGKISTAAGVPTYSYPTITTSGASTVSNSVIPFGNITQAQAYAVIQGPVPLSYFTNNASDVNKYALAVGRSEDAGARTVPFAEAQTGFGNATRQFQLAFTGSTTSQADGLATGGTAATVSGIKIWPASAPLNTEPSINWNTAGHSGYNLTSDLSNVLSATNPVLAGSFSSIANTPSGATHFYFVGYNGVADTGTLVNNGGIALSYNGVPYSPGAVRNGQYSLWSFAHLYYIGSGTGALTGVPKQAADDIADTIFTTDADVNGSGNNGQSDGAGIFFDSSVLVTRSVEGGYVTPLTY